MLFNGPDSPKIAHFPLGDLEPHLIMVPWAHASLSSNRRLDWFSRFAGFTNVTRQTHTDTLITILPHPYEGEVTIKIVNNHRSENKISKIAIFP